MKLFDARIYIKRLGYTTLKQIFYGRGSCFLEKKARNACSHRNNNEYGINIRFFQVHIFYDNLITLKTMFVFRQFHTSNASTIAND